MTLKNKHLVLVHGYLGSSLNWGPIIFKLQKHPDLQGWTFSAVDLLWHGRRIGPEEPSEIHLSTMAQDFAEQVKGKEPFVALGHSFGLRPILRYASQHPGNLAAIVSEDSSPEISETGGTELDRVLRGVPVPFSSRAEAKTYLDTQFGAEPSMSRFLLSNIREISEGKHAWRFQADALDHLLKSSLQESLWQEWSEFQGPIFMINGGKKSSFLSDQRIEKAMRVREGKETELHVIDQAGHWVHSEQPDLFTNCLVKVLRKLE